MRRGPSRQDVERHREARDLIGLLGCFAGTKRRDVRRDTLAALAALDVRSDLVDLLGDEQHLRQAAAALVELGEESFAVVAEQLQSADQVRRQGSLYAVYLYARYRDLPAAHELLKEVAGGSHGDDLREPARLMSEKVERLTRARNETIDGHLERIRASLEREQFDGGSVVTRMYSAIHSGRMEALKSIIGLRYAGVRHIVAVVPRFGEATVGALLGLGIEELGGGIVPLLAEGLRHGDRRTRSYLLATLIGLRRAGIPGAAEVLEAAGIDVTEAMDRRAAHYYRKWVRE